MATTLPISATTWITFWPMSVPNSAEVVSRRLETLLPGFGPYLRARGFAATPDQSATFLKAIPLLDVAGLDDLRLAARIVFGPEPARRDEFAAHFDRYFQQLTDLRLGDEAEAETSTLSLAAEPPPNEELHDNSPRNEAGSDEQLGSRAFPGSSLDPDVLRPLVSALPVRRSHRWVQTRARGEAANVRSSLRQCVYFEGDVPYPMWRRRRQIARQVIVLIDVSGSMKKATQDYLLFAYGLMRLHPDVSVFTFATRLTEVTVALRKNSVAAALSEASETVPDWDGGTSIGRCVSDLLAHPHCANRTRGAVVIVISDGLERGDASELVQASKRLALRARTIIWATPLAADPDFAPRTKAMAALLPYIDALGDGSDARRLASFVTCALQPAGMKSCRK
ncbi:VWA domain-containing protein [Mesorhizobium australicum]|uniref:vWA domain-containing protein n=1 Tax=Mesorhizobium australicum TaxID=536018 RepID=UPI00333D7698